MNNQVLTIVVSALSDFVISAGGALTTAMVATGQTNMPSPAVLIFASVTGLIAAARGVRALMANPPGGTVSTSTKTETTTVDVPKGGS